MSESTRLVVYCLLVLLASLMGGYVPFMTKITHGRLQLYLSLSAGVMLGASFFHVMPEAMDMAGANFGWWMSLGVVGLFCIERFIAPHSHEMDGSNHEHGGAADGHEHSHSHGHSHVEPANAPHEPRAAAPAIAGWMAVCGLTIHTFMNGVGLAGAVRAGVEDALPGIAMFLAIILHKPADALAISVVLSRKGVSGRVLGLVQLAFGLMVPLGVAAFLVTAGAIEDAMQHQLTGAALAFSAGTFLFIALSDLLPEVQFHRHDRFVLFMALLLGVAIMGGIGILEGHDHGGGAGAVEDHSHHHHKH